MKLSYLLVFLLLSVVGCIKKEEDQPINDGPAADTNSIAESETEALEDRNLLDASVSEFVVYEVTAQPFNSSPQVLQYLTSQIMEKNDKGLYFELAILRRTIIPKDNGNDEVVETMDRCKVYKDSGESTCAPANLESQSVGVNNFQMNFRTSPGRGLTTLAKETSVHNYTRTVLSQPPPSAVKNSPTCADTPNCLFRTTRIEYDIIVKEDGNRQKYRILREFSPDAPPMAVENRLCQSSNQRINGRLIPVILCYTLVNYKYGAQATVELAEIKNQISSANNLRTLAHSSTNEITLRLHARRVGNNPYQTESLQFQIGANDNGLVTGHTILTDSAGATIREGEKQCTESSLDEDCQGYPLLDPALVPLANGDTKFYNLSVVSYKTSLPEPVQKRKGCSDPQACPMNATLVRFLREDVVNGIKLRTVHAMEISPEVPVINSLSFRCSRGFSGTWPEVSSTRSCMILTDFMP